MRWIVAALAALLVLAAPAAAVPPGGPVENTLGAAVVLDPTAVAPAGAITFAGTGFQPAERVTVKVDDGEVRTTAGGDQFTVVDAAADGTVAGTVDLATAAAPLAAGAHDLRFLSSSSLGARSFSVAFTVTAAAPVTPAEPGAPTTPSTPAGPEAENGPAEAAPATIASRSLRARGGKVIVRLRGGDAGGRVAVSVRTRAKVRTGKRRAIVTVARARTVAVDAGATASVSLRLTQAGKALLGRVDHVAVRVRAGDVTGVLTLHG